MPLALRFPPSTLTGCLWCLHSLSSLKWAESLHKSSEMKKEEKARSCHVLSSSEHADLYLYNTPVVWLENTAVLFSDFSVYIFLPFVLRSPPKPSYERWVEGKKESRALIRLANAALRLGSGLCCQRASPESRPASFSSRPFRLLPPGEVHCGLLNPRAVPPCIMSRSLSQSGRSGGQGRVGGVWESAKCSSGIKLLGEEGKTLRQ